MAKRVAIHVFLLVFRVKLRFKGERVRRMQWRAFQVCCSFVDMR